LKKLGEILNEDEKSKASWDDEFWLKNKSDKAVFAVQFIFKNPKNTSCLLTDLL